jgi:hypothetical protein
MSVLRPESRLKWNGSFSIPTRRLGRQGAPMRIEAWILNPISSMLTARKNHLL